MKVCSSRLRRGGYSFQNESLQALLELAARRSRAVAHQEADETTTISVFPQPARHPDYGAEAGAFRQALSVSAGSIASLPSITFEIVPSFSITNVTRFA